MDEHVMNIPSTSKYIGTKTRFTRHWWKVLFEQLTVSRSKRERKRLRKEMRKTAVTLIEFRKDGAT